MGWGGAGRAGVAEGELRPEEWSPDINQLAFEGAWSGLERLDTQRASILAFPFMRASVSLLLCLLSIQYTLARPVFWTY